MLIVPAPDTNESPGLSPAMVALLRQHFWCDFADVIPTMQWDDVSSPQ